MDTKTTDADVAYTAVADGSARAIRVRGGYSLGDFAGLLNIAAETVNRWETTREPPREPIAERYGRLLRQVAGITAGSARNKAV